MSAARIMHVDDEPDVRDVVRASLGLDPGMTLRSCVSGEEALAAAVEWRPDLILLDAVMPRMDGPRTLAMLHRDRHTTAIPIVFTTGKAEPREVDFFKSLGAAGVLAKPFDATTLATSLRRFLKPKPPDTELMQQEFLDRARGYAEELVKCRMALAAERDQADELVHVRQIAHLLAGSGELFSCVPISVDARALEDALIAEAPEADIRKAIDALVTCILATDEFVPLVDAGSREIPASRQGLLESALPFSMARSRLP